MWTIDCQQPRLYRVASTCSTRQRIHSNPALFRHIRYFKALMMDCTPNLSSCDDEFIVLSMAHTIHNKLCIATVSQITKCGHRGGRGAAPIYFIFVICCMCVMLCSFVVLLNFVSRNLSICEEKQTFKSNASC